MNFKVSVKRVFKDLQHIFYPHNCIACGTDVLQTNQVVCVQCFQQLPFTHFEDFARNPVEKTFYGRARIEEAAAVLYFTKHSMVQKLMFELKYRSNENAGLFLGNMIGNAMLHSDRFRNIDLLIPVPINEKRLRQRGYNQADILIAGLQQKIFIPSSETAVTRSLFTETQTHKDRTGRWQNMQTVFSVPQPDALLNKHILIIDDVITTGATIEALVNSIHSQVECKISVIAAAWTSQ